MSNPAVTAHHRRLRTGQRRGGPQERAETTLRKDRKALFGFCFLLYSILDFTRAVDSHGPPRTPRIRQNFQQYNNNNNIRQVGPTFQLPVLLVRRGVHGRPYYSRQEIITPVARPAQTLLFIHSTYEIMSWNTRRMHIEPYICNINLYTSINFCTHI